MIICDLLWKLLQVIDCIRLGDGQMKLAADDGDHCLFGCMCL